MNVTSTKVADAFIIQHPRVHLRESRNRTRERATTESKHTGNGKLGAIAYYADFTFAEDYGHNDSKVETADAYRAQNDSVNPGSEVIEEAFDCEDAQKYDMFSPYLTLDDVSFLFETAELDAIALLTGTWDDDVDPEVSLQLVQASVRAYLSFGRKKVRPKVRAIFLFIHHVYH